MLGSTKLMLAFMAMLTLTLGACGNKAPVADRMDIEVTLAKDVQQMGRSIQVDLVAVSSADQAKYAAKAVKDWFRGGDADRTDSKTNGTSKPVIFSPGGPTTIKVSRSDPFWDAAMKRQAIHLYVFGLVAGDDTTGKDVAWRKELPMDPARYANGMVKIEVQTGGVTATNLMPEKK